MSYEHSISIIFGGAEQSDTPQDQFAIMFSESEVPAGSRTAHGEIHLNTP